MPTSWSGNRLRMEGPPLYRFGPLHRRAIQHGCDVPPCTSPAAFCTGMRSKQHVQRVTYVHQLINILDVRLLVCVFGESVQLLMHSA